jgi:hypothetical protein
MTELTETATQIAGLYKVTTKVIGGHIKEPTIGVREIIVNKISERLAKDRGPDRANHDWRVRRKAMESQQWEGGKVRENVLLDRAAAPEFDNLVDTASSLMGSFRVKSEPRDNWLEADTTKFLRPIEGHGVEGGKEVRVLSKEERMDALNQGLRTGREKSTMARTNRSGALV